MKAALLLIDLQQDFLSRPGLTPIRDDIVKRATVLLSSARRHGLPVFHVHTLIDENGSNAMPHWRKKNQLRCIENSVGAHPPPELSLQSGEWLISKRFFSGFDNPELQTLLGKTGADTVIIAGIYLHGCVRNTAIDAYSRNYRVVIASDATGSTEPLHAEVSREYLEGRVAEFLSVDEILSHLSSSPNSLPLPCAWIDGKRINSGSPGQPISHKNPSNSKEEIFSFRAADRTVIQRAVAASHAAQAGWSKLKIDERASLLMNWKKRLQKEKINWVKMIVREIGKPLRDAEEEVSRAVSHLSSIIDTALTKSFEHKDFDVRYRPLGTVALVTPWNNPIAIPIGKLVPALVYGNSVIWKPSPHASKIAEALLQSLYESPFPPSLVNLVLGDGESARQLMLAPGVSAVSLTGSQATGATASALCALTGKPLQAELGGNNALIVLPGENLNTMFEGFARSAFGFSGQRCTAIRRFIIEKSICEEFVTKLAQATDNLRVGMPDEPTTDIGPLISRQHREKVRNAIDQACAEGAQILVGREALSDWDHGCWLQPTLITSVKPNSSIVQNETFGPVAVIQQAEDLVDAIQLANCVSQGLVAGLIGGDENDRSLFLETIKAGIIKLGSLPLSIHGEAPFGGSKASRLGPPEHGYWDREFYTRPQAIYY